MLRRDNSTPSDAVFDAVEPVPPTLPAQPIMLEPERELPAPHPKPELPAPEPMPELPAPEPKPELPAPEPKPELPAPGPKPEIPAREMNVPSTSVSYTVQQGETLWGIAKKFGTTVEALAAANHVEERSQLRAGQRLNIPR